MNILSSQLPSEGFGYPFAAINIKPMTFLDVVEYLESVPKDPLSKYLYDINWLVADDPNIKKCYIMDIDYLRFMKKLTTVSPDLSMEITVTCPDCGKTLKKKLRIVDIMFKTADPIVMNGAVVKLKGRTYSVTPPTVEEFHKVFQKYLKFRKVSNLDLIKLIALIDDFYDRPNEVEDAVLSATHDDITALLALKDLYFNRVDPVKMYCDICNNGLKKEERRELTVSIDELIVDFFREITINNQLDEDKIQFKQVLQTR